MKNPLTPAGIEPATYRFVAQHFNHCAAAVPTEKMWSYEFIYRKKKKNAPTNSFTERSVGTHSFTKNMPYTFTEKKLTVLAHLQKKSAGTHSFTKNMPYSFTEKS